jgi:CDP-diacylglycerol--serine O-phosphatidyltransferase
MMARLPRIPDLLTTANLACGMGSILLASQGQLTWACWLVFAGALFDVFDGLAARALGGGSPLGAQLDSMADMVTFGVAPMFVIFNIPDSMFLGDCVGCGVRVDWFGLGIEPSKMIDLGKGLFLAPIPICSAWRLAKFNVDTRQTSGFLGLPTPANALFWASIPLILKPSSFGPGVFGEDLRMILWNVLRMPHSLPLIFCMPSILGILMLSELPLPSLKFKHFQWKGNEVIYLLLGIGAVLVALYGMLAVPLILVLYLFSPLWGRLFPKVG